MCSIETYVNEDERRRLLCTEKELRADLWEVLEWTVLMMTNVMLFVYVILNEPLGRPDDDDDDAFPAYILNSQGFEQHGIELPDSLKFHPYRIVYDIETYFEGDAVGDDDDEEGGLRFGQRHVPLSVSVVSNVDGFVREMWECEWQNIKEMNDTAAEVAESVSGKNTAAWKPGRMSEQTVLRLSPAKVTNRGFRMDAHNEMRTYVQKKTGLTYFYPKRKVLQDGTSTIPLDI
nr:hypothetical protein BaRGS_004634 [Batillaria attramentaria]